MTLVNEYELDDYLVNQEVQAPVPDEQILLIGRVARYADVIQDVIAETIRGITEYRGSNPAENFEFVIRSVWVVGFQMGREFETTKLLYSGKLQQTTEFVN